MQPSRLLSIKSPLGEDALIVTRLSVTEELGLPFTIEAEVLGRESGLMAADLLMKDVTITVTRHAESPLERHFHGAVAEFRRIAPGPAGLMVYRLVAVPRLRWLGLRRNCRIFQDKTVTDIVNKVLRDHGLPEPSYALAGAQFKPIPYCTQFNETDLHFIARLLEEHGLTYYFTHGESAHTMAVASAAQGFPQFEGGELEALHGGIGSSQLGGWRRGNRIRSGEIDLLDMDTDLLAQDRVQHAQAPTRAYAEEPAMQRASQVFHWPGGMATRPGLPVAEIAMGLLEAESEDFAAEARDPRLGAGMRAAVAVRQEDGSVQNRQYLITGVRHQASDESGTGAGGGVEHYGATLALVSAARVWRPAMRHPRPVMPGLQSATVTGPAGEQIHVDKHGRIKVQFRWDRLGRKDETTSCWMRVMQSVAGGWGGAWYLPRIGDEVLVAFLDGDPDRPLVVGSVYNEEHGPPFKPAEHKARSGYLTRSDNSKNAANANMLRFEDKMGEEEVRLHAEKDLVTEVENDEARSVGNDQTETIGNNRTVTVDKGDDTLTLKQGSRVETIEMGNDDLTLKMGNASRTLEMGNDGTQLKMGNYSLTCDLGKVTIEALQSIELKVGQSSVKIDQMGVTIKGMMVSSEAQLMLKTKGLMVEEKADALMTIGGGIVMIN